MEVSGATAAHEHHVASHVSSHVGPNATAAHEQHVASHVSSHVCSNAAKFAARADKERLI